MANENRKSCTFEIRRVPALVLAVWMLTACSSGGGGSPVTSGSNNANTSSNVTPNATSRATNPANITAPGAATLGGNSPNLATGSTPAFIPGSGPPNGTVLTLTTSAVNLSPTSATDANIGATTFTTGNPTPANAPTYTLGGGLKAATIGLEVPPTGGQPNGGGQFELNLSNLNYTLLGQWDFQPPLPGGANGTTTFGYSVGGFQTPQAALPATGSTTYSGNASPTSPSLGIARITGPNGGAVGNLFLPDLLGGVTRITIAGNVSLTVNFSTGSVTGNLTNMQFLATGSSFGPWNDVSLNGSLSGSSLVGATSTAGPPPNSGNAGFAASSTGKFNGALYGPNAQEVGAVWSLYDPGGKSALGGFAAK